MKYYFLQQNGAYQTLIDKNEDHLLGMLSAEPSQDTALNFDFSKYELIYSKRENKRKKNSDIYTGFFKIIVTSKHALECLKEAKGMESNIILDVRLPSENLIALYVGNELHKALDRELSSFDEYENGLVVHKHVIDAKSLDGSDIFRIKESPMKIIVSEKFREKIDAFKLKGFEFIEVTVNS